MHPLLQLLDRIDLDSLELLKLFNDAELRMKQTTFKYAIKGMGLQKSTIDRVYRVLVNGESRQKIIEETGMNQSHLSKTLNNIYKNLKKRCEEDGLILTDEYLINQRYKPTLKTLEILETETLDEVNHKRHSLRRK